MSQTHASDATECAATCAIAAIKDRQLDADVQRLDRRGFLTKSMLIAAAGALAACSGGDAFSSTPSSVGNASLTLADYPALATVGGIALVTLNGVRLAVVRTGASSFIALSRTCPHEGATIGTNTSGGFTCPEHGARFDASGTWIGGQRTSNMRSYTTTYNASAGTLTIG